LKSTKKSFTPIRGTPRGGLGGESLRAKRTYAQKKDSRSSKGQKKLEKTF